LFVNSKHCVQNKLKTSRIKRDRVYCELEYDIILGFVILFFFEFDWNLKNREWNRIRGKDINKLKKLNFKSRVTHTR